MYSLKVIANGNENKAAWEKEQEARDCQLTDVMNMLWNEEDIALHISLNALIGRNTFQKMKVIGHIGKYEIHILIDSGIPRNFIYCETTKKFRCQMKKTYPLQVTVANGNNMELTMKFMYKGKVINLRGIKSASTMLKPLLKEYYDVFAIPKELPSFRSHDHIIPLKEGTSPVNIIPHRHPPIQKDAIKSMVQELLDSSVIVNVISPLICSGVSSLGITSSSSIIISSSHASHSYCCLDTYVGESLAGCFDEEPLADFELLEVLCLFTIFSPSKGAHLLDGHHVVVSEIHHPCKKY
uniref:Reverse transcriptase domain-containing protein n=1 Tax=Tanacetum cinerariifolium TaxID=118510 RepID=A0A6L2JNW8_TANCI|nr:hypothetical protein [Tanacetum cinerariifolium]